jgi:hypothetical protein
MLTSRNALAYSIVMATAMAFSNPATAAILTATPADFVSVFNSAVGGDTIRVSGKFGTFNLQNKAFSSLVTIDATGATFADSITIANVSKLKIIGGTYGSKTAALRTSRAIGLSNSSDISFSRMAFVGNGTGFGLTIAGSTNVSVSALNFNKFRLGLGVVSSEQVRISSSAFTGMSSDGVNIVDSRFVTATTNRCSGNLASPGSHPDCMQLWSIAGKPMQSDIVLTRNTVTGATQGLTSFDPDDASGLRISITDNIINTSFPQGIACYGCVDSVFTGNKLTTLPGSQFRTSMNIIGGVNNVISNNSVGAKPTTVSAQLDPSSSIAGDPEESGGAGDAGSDYDPFSYFDEPVPDFALEYLSGINIPDNVPVEGSIEEDPFTAFSGRDFSAAIAAVPEPMLWAQMLLGFALAGTAVRRQVSNRVVAA